MRSLGFILWQATIAMLLFGSAMTGPISYDEEQYVAASVLARDLHLYADLVYLQPPLYPLILSRLFDLTGGWYLLTARLLTWILSLGCGALLLRILRLLGAGRLMAMLLATACLLSPFVFVPVSCSRNDIMPLFFFLAGLLFHLRATGDAAVRRRGLSLFLAGLLLGLAVEAKISYAFAPSIALPHLVATRGADGRPEPWSRLLPFLAGTALAALPGLHFLVTAPEGFLYGLLQYHLTAPIAWYEGQGKAELLEAPYRAALLLGLLGIGGNASLVMLLLLLVPLRRRQGPGPRDATGTGTLLAGLLAGAALLGYLPRPSWPMYFAAVAPLLACCAALLHRRIRAAGSPRLLPLLVAVAMLPSLFVLGPRLDRLSGLAAPERWAGLVAHRHAREIREAMRQAGVEGHVATLFPLHVLDANPIRPEFASGPFFYRTAGLLPPERAVGLRGIGADGLGALFADDPPAAIFGGLHGSVWREPMDAALLDYAERHGYRLVRQDMGGAGTAGGRLYVRPGAAFR